MDGSVPARWLEISVEPPSPGSADRVTRRLLELGGRAVVEAEGRLVTYLPEPADPAAVVERLRGSLADDLEEAEVDVRVGWRPHRDWAELWKRGLSPRRVTPRLVVTPSWCHPDAGPDDIVITLDPGMAFGTAEHGTTRGCLRLLDSVVRPGDRVVDVGAGSGILSIAAAHLGAVEVLALEGDAWAVEPARENVAANGVEGAVEVRATWVGVEDLAALGARDGLVANLEAAVLRRLLPGFRDAVRIGGWLVMGGIRDSEMGAITREAEEVGFRREVVDVDGEWRSGRFRRV